MTDLKEMYQNVKSKPSITNERLQNTIGFIALIAFCGWLFNRYINKKCIKSS